MLCAMPVTLRISGLDELLDQQFSVISRSQLLTLGMSDHAMQYRIRRGGPWQTLLPGVYLGVSGAPNLPQKEMAASAHTQGRAALSPDRWRCCMLACGAALTWRRSTCRCWLNGSAVTLALSGCTARGGCRDELRPVARFVSLRRRARWPIPHYSLGTSGRFGLWWRMLSSWAAARWANWPVS